MGMGARQLTFLLIQKWLSHSHKSGSFFGDYKWQVIKQRTLDSECQEETNGNYEEMTSSKRKSGRRRRHLN
jgi:hypothetical protein